MAAADQAPTNGDAEDQDYPLPPLREDLHLLPAERDEYGAPGWTIHDPVRNRYFRIGLPAFEMLSRWGASTAQALVDQVNAETILSLEVADVDGLIRFLHGNGLLIRLGDASVAEFGRIHAAGKPPFLKWLLHHYLFIRIPLVRPDRFLRKTQWIADLFASRAAHITVLTLGIIGLFLTLRQWDRFIGTFMQFANWQGALWIALTLTLTKVLHELGHAYTATRYGCRVPTMGVAFLVMYPVLYTDTSDAWKLTNHIDRLRIGSAGIRVELALALIATFLWHVVPEGLAQSAAFLVASTTWVSTLLVNMSPFMRFDGYYLLSDYLRVPNLQDRAFALARWKIREMLFGLGAPMPEPFSEKRQRTLILYAFGVWIYRLTLFLGIALVVYHLFFKILGILLFMVEIGWFIALPVFRELTVWWRHRGQMKPTNMFKALAGGLAAALILFAVPWRGTVTGAAILEAQADTPVLTASAGRLTAVKVKNGEVVKAGDVLFQFSSPELDDKLAGQRLQLQEAEISLAQARVGGRALATVSPLEKEALRLKAGLESLKAREDLLTIRAPIAGRVRDLAEGLHNGTWFSAKTPLARIVSTEAGGRVVAYVSQTDIGRLRANPDAHFLADSPTAKILKVTIDDIDKIGASTLEAPALASIFGGPLAARRTEHGRLVPVDAVYRVTGHIDVSTAPMAAPFAQARRGTLKLDASAQSLLVRAYQSVVAALLRETSF
ncbi:HlyD family efflux transporter periplasmic adaptor subunit [Kordiimonas marina]|uniref:HlyD family efflux transporter periplasmic adaptor subunit n=1 Tax=Kordiimonas marina TaxID=2872312 RepID=UPI001FF292F5|nr:HlyD family efflux transporter periplasmic adaptor subunit [Kordiimonas marina]MCJ9429443.1 HlyD family efflux transporter periplasmic adaptor subunit [Kordiimonas marina]